MDESRFRDPEYLLKDETVKVYADIMVLLDEHGFANTIGADLFLLTVDLHGLISDFVKTYERLHASGDLADSDQRKTSAERFRQHVLHGDAIAPRFTGLVDFMTEMIER